MGILVASPTSSTTCTSYYLRPDLVIDVCRHLWNSFKNGWIHSSKSLLFTWNPKSISL